MYIFWEAGKDELDYDFIKDNRSKNIAIIINYMTDYFSCIYISSDENIAYYYNPTNDVTFPMSMYNKLRVYCEIILISYTTLNTEFIFDNDSKNCGIYIVEFLFRSLTNQEIIKQDGRMLRYMYQDLLNENVVNRKERFDTILDVYIKLYLIGDSKTFIKKIKKNENFYEKIHDTFVESFKETHDLKKKENEAKNKLQQRLRQRQSNKEIQNLTDLVNQKHKDKLLKHLEEYQKDKSTAFKKVFKNDAKDLLDETLEEEELKEEEPREQKQRVTSTKKSPKQKIETLMDDDYDDYNNEEEEELLNDHKGERKKLSEERRKREEDRINDLKQQFENKMQLFQIQQSK